MGFIKTKICFENYSFDVFDLEVWHLFPGVSNFFCGEFLCADSITIRVIQGLQSKCAWEELCLGRAMPGKSCTRPLQKLRLSKGHVKNLTERLEI